MSSFRTPQSTTRDRQVLVQPGDFGYQDTAPEALRPRLGLLCQDLAKVCGKWDTYQQLFGTPEAREVLSVTARAAFADIEESLRADITMSVCRLAEHVGSGERQNLTIRVLVQDLPADDEVRRAVEDSHDAWNPFKTLRDKVVAHNDLRARLDPTAYPLLEVNARDVTRVLELAGELLGRISARYTDSQLFFKPLRIGDGNDLIHWLRRGLSDEEAEMARLRASLPE